MKKGHGDRYLLAHDLGTSGNKAVLYSLDGRRVAAHEHAYDTSYPRPGYAEQDPEQWWTAVCESTRQLLAGAEVGSAEVAAVSFSAQMMGCLPVDRSGIALRPAIIWADMRSGRQAELLEQALGMQQVYRITGHRISSSYSGTKLRWVQDNQPDLYKRTFKTLQTKDFIIQRLTGEFVTDYSDACGTNLFDIEARKWSPAIAAALGIDMSMLPDAFPSTHRAGTVSAEAARATGLTEGTPVIVGGGDGVCAATGATVVEPGSAYVVIGTSSWIATASEHPVFDPHLRTFNWVHIDGTMYSPCGTMQSAGFSYAWLRDRIREFNQLTGCQAGDDLDTALTGAVADSRPGAANLLFLPYLMGERSPRWNPDARGAFVGLGATHTAADVIRSVLEGVGFNLRVILDVFRTTDAFEEIIAIGGGAQNRTWLQILADIWNARILVPRYVEDATSMGAALCAGVGIGAFGGFGDVKSFNPVEHVIEPSPERHEQYARLYPVFNEAYDSLVSVYSHLSRLE
ncbi:MAG: xylulokinase [Spirochaetaceae bacterium]|nr:MAG: xylulokinase [Spirochaetaceae bacterium]